MTNETARLMGLFRRWAPEHLPYHGLEARVRTAGRDSACEYTVGMRAERLDRRFVLHSRLGWSALIGAIAAKNLADSPPMTVGPFDVANSLFVLAVLTLATAAMIRSKTRTYAWIEFLPDAAPLTRAPVEWTQRAVAHVRNSPDAPWVPAEIVLVSGESGFEPDAVVLADSANIACYRLTGSDFEQVLTAATRTE